MSRFARTVAATGVVLGTLGLAGIAAASPPGPHCNVRSGCESVPSAKDAAKPPTSPRKNTAPAPPASLGEGIGNTGH